MRVARALLTLAFAALAAFAFGPVFGGLPPAPIGLGVAVAALASLAVVVRPTLAPALVGLGATGVVVAGVLTAGAGLDVLSGPMRLLSGAVPADRTGAGVAAVAIVAGWTTLASGLWAASSRHALPPLLPALLTLGVALGLGASAGPLPGWYAPVAVALLAALLLAARPPRDPGVSSVEGRGRWLGPAVGVLVAAVGVLATGLLGPYAPGVNRTDPADLRALVAAPVQPRSGVSPLQQYLALRDGNRPLRLTGTASRPGLALRMATLTAFDGTYWTVRGDYRRAGTVLAGPAAGERVDVHIDVAAGELDWLLSPGRPVRVSLGGLGVDEATGDVAVPVGQAPPRSYDASAVLAEPSADEILAADAAPAPGPLTPPLPPALASFAATAVADAPDGPDELLALRHRFVDAGDFRYDQAQEVTGGHGYYQLQRLLDTHRGTSEQYASAFAVMARHLGFDARVVMGFRPVYQDGGFTVTGRDVDAWVEVRFATLGWVSVDPSPRGNPIGTRPGAPAAVLGGRSGDPLAEPPTTAEPPAPVDLGVGPGAAGSGGGAWTVPVAAAVVLLALASVPLAKLTRRSRRRRAGPVRAAVLGAWWETLDRLREAGIAAGASRTTTEVAALAGAPPGVRDLAAVVDRTVFAPEDPPESLRRDAWAAATQARRDLAARRGPVRRALAWLDPRTLRS